MKERFSGIPENVRIHYSRDVSDSRKREIESEVQRDLAAEIDPTKVPEIKNECEKQAWQGKAIADAGFEIKSFFSQALDLDIPEIDPDKVHVLKAPDLQQVCRRLKMPKVEAQGACFRGAILLSADYENHRSPRTGFIRTLIHEALHQRAFKKMAEMDFRGTGVVAEGRTGLSMREEKQGLVNEWSFVALDEGLTAFLEKTIFHNLLTNNPAYTELADELFAKVDKKIDRKTLFSFMGMNSYDVADCEVAKREGKETYNWEISGAYLDEQELIFQVAGNILKADPGKYKDFDDVLGLFLRAQYRGEMSPLAKAVDKTFGRGSFLLLAAIPRVHNPEGVNPIVRNVRKFLGLPLDKRDPELARKYIFGGDSPMYLRYLKARK